MLLNDQRGENCFDGFFQYCLEPQDGTPVSRIMRRGCVAPPSMRLYTLLENLWGDQPGTWAFALTPTDYEASDYDASDYIHEEFPAGGILLSGRGLCQAVGMAGQGWLD